MHTVVLSPDAGHPICAALCQLLRDHLDRRGPTLAPLDGAEDLLRRDRPGLLVVVLSPDPEAALARLAQLRGLAPGRVLAVGPAADSRLILQALQGGADHYLDEAELEKQLGAFLARLREQAGDAGGRVIAVLGASGGCGASTLAVNLAAVLAREHGRCLLMDLKTGLGDLAALLNLKPGYTLADLCLNAARMDRDLFEAALARHASGISLLAPPQRFDDIRLVTPQGVAQTLAVAREAFPFTVADLEDCHHQEQTRVLQQADAVLVVLRLEFTTLRNARRVLGRLDHLGVPSGRVHLVVNRHGQAKELPAGDVKGALGRTVAHLIPDDPRTVNAANNAGEPAVLRAPSAKVSRAIERLAAALGGRREAPAPAGGGFRQLARSVNGWLASLC